MNTRLASTVTAVVFAVSAVASPVLAQSYTAPAGISAAAAPGNADAQARSQTRSYDDVTTGSISARRRGHDSAQEGNADHNSFPVWQYGRTSGGAR